MLSVSLCLNASQTRKVNLISSYFPDLNARESSSYSTGSAANHWRKKPVCDQCRTATGLLARHLSLEATVKWSK